MFSRAFLLFLLIKASRAYFVNEEDCLNYTVYPVQYELVITPYDSRDDVFFYNCDLTLTVIANAPNVNVISLDAKDLEIKTGSVRVINGVNNKNMVNVYRPYEYDKRMGKLYIYLNEALRQYKLYKNQYYIKLSFNKYVKYNSSGVFVVRYEDEGPRYVVTTRLSPNKAKYFFPCIDNPQFESVFKFKVYGTPTQTNSRHTFNTSLAIAKKYQQETPVDYQDFVPSSQIALHQVGFHLSQFGSRQIKSKYSDDSLIIWAPTSALQHYNFILNFGRILMVLIHEYASIDRPILDGPINIVAVPSDLNGYEIGSWNLLTNADTRLVYVKEYTSIKQLERMTFQLAQQLCRIWLGNPGEPQRTRWKEEWFKEGMATYLAYYFFTQYNRGSQTMKRRYPISTHGIQMKHKAMSLDWPHTTPALVYLNRTLAIEIPSRYRELVAMKTASIIWMVENWLGSEKFHHALVKYINSRRGKFISLEDFTAALDQDTVECQHQFLNGSTASRVLNSWFHKPGYPVVNVQVLRDRTPNAIQLKQSRFTFNKNNRQTSDYMIPISYFIEHNEHCFNCHQPRFTIGSQAYSFEENLNGGWIILNRNASGYYRVNYDAETWKIIARTLRENHLYIDQLNRAQIVNDALALYAAGDIDYQLALEVLDYLHSEGSQIVWESVIDGFELLKIEGAGCHMSKILYEQWKDFLRSKVHSLYDRLYNDIERLPETRLFRSKIIKFACLVHDQSCIEHMRHLYRGHSNQNRRIHPDFRETFYYWILTDNSGNFKMDNINRFELEDANMIKHEVAEENRFIYRIPIGVPKPMPIIMVSTTPAVTELFTVSPSNTGVASSSAWNIASTTMILVVIGSVLFLN